MKCEEVLKTLPLFLYGELSFEDEERLEAHIDQCESCRAALATDKAMFRSLDDAELLPTQDMLDDSRAKLRQRLVYAEPVHASFWDKVRQGFSINFHFAPGLAQPVGAVLMLALGFLGARFAPSSITGKLGFAGVVTEPVSSRVRYVEPVSAGKVQIVVDETHQRVLSGNIEDPSIQRFLLTAAKDPSDAGLR